MGETNLMINIFAHPQPPQGQFWWIFYLGPRLTLTLFPLLFCSETSEDSCLLVNLWGNNGTCHCWFAMGGSAVKWCVPIFNKARYMYFVLTWYIQMSHNVHNVLSLPVDKATLDVAEASPKSFWHQGVEDWVEDRVEVVENTWRKSKGRVHGLEGQMSQNNPHVFWEGRGWVQIFSCIFIYIWLVSNQIIWQLGFLDTCD